LIFVAMVITCKEKQKKSVVFWALSLTTKLWQALCEELCH
jgi:hypothetical protein